MIKQYLISFTMAMIISYLLVNLFVFMKLGFFLSLSFHTVLIFSFYLSKPISLIIFFSKGMKGKIKSSIVIVCSLFIYFLFGGVQPFEALGVFAQKVNVKWPLYMKHESGVQTFNGWQGVILSKDEAVLRKSKNKRKSETLHLKSNSLIDVYYQKELIWSDLESPPRFLHDKNKKKIKSDEVSI